MSQFLYRLGRSAAVLLDVTVVRMGLVPATMAMPGNANRWLPSWLDRGLPHLDLGGAADRGTTGEAEREPGVIGASDGPPTDGEIEPAPVGAGGG